jgi:hypothetical protein
MPQLDKFSFVTQVFWLLVLYFFLYIVMLQYILPAIYRILKIRKEIIDNLISDNSKLFDEEVIVRAVYKELLSTSIFKTVDFLKLFQKRLVIYRNMCNLFLNKGFNFDISREERKNTFLALNLKKQILNTIVK